MARNFQSSSGGCAAKKRRTSQEEDAQPCTSGLEGLGTLEPGTAVQFVESRFRTALDAFQLLPIALQHESRGRIRNMLADLLADTPSSRVTATQTDEQGLAFPLAKLPDTVASRVLSYLSLGDLIRVHRVRAHCNGLVESELMGSTITVSQDQFQRQALLQSWSSDFPTALSGFLSSHGSKLRKLVVILSFLAPVELKNKVAGFIGDNCENIVDLGYSSYSGYLYGMFSPEQFMRLGRLKNLFAGLQIKSLEGFNLVQHRLQNVNVAWLSISQEVLDKIMVTPDRGLTATSQALSIPNSLSFASSKLTEMVRFEQLRIERVNCTKFLKFLPQGLTSLELFNVTSVFNASDLESLIRLSNITKFRYHELGPDCCIDNFRFLQAYKFLEAIYIRSRYFNPADFLHIPTQAPLVSVYFCLRCNRVSSDAVLAALLARKCRMVKVILDTPIKVCEDSPVWKLLSQCRQSLQVVRLIVESNTPRFDFRSMLNQLSVHLLEFGLSGSWSVSAADLNGFLAARRLIFRDPVRSCAPLRMTLPLADWEKTTMDETIDRARLAGVELTSCD